MTDEQKNHYKQIASKISAGEIDFKTYGIKQVNSEGLNTASTDVSFGSPNHIVENKLN